MPGARAPRSVRGPAHGGDRGTRPADRGAPGDRARPSGSCGASARPRRRWPGSGTATWIRPTRSGTSPRPGSTGGGRAARHLQRRPATPRGAAPPLAAAPRTCRQARRRPPRPPAPPAPSTAAPPPNRPYTLIYADSQRNGWNRNDKAGRLALKRNLRPAERQGGGGPGEAPPTPKPAGGAGGGPPPPPP